MPREPTIKSPEQCSKEERAAFVAVTEKSNEVDRDDLESGFDRARHVLWTSDARGLAGVAASKVLAKAIGNGFSQRQRAGFHIRRIRSSSATSLSKLIDVTKAMGLFLCKRL
jgi:hypothetical protein